MPRNWYIGIRYAISVSLTAQRGVDGLGQNHSALSNLLILILLHHLTKLCIKKFMFGLFLVSSGMLAVTLFFLTRMMRWNHQTRVLFFTVQQNLESEEG